ncbi:hypothetical protein HYV86_05295 [Candidatus Woesearchaeota archaeon]|nr:hypothetical protein [Candidatus Woesearchaeota archaeon]
MPNLTQTKVIAGKNVTITFIFKKYKAHHLTADLEELKVLQQKQGAQRIGKVLNNALEKEELDLRWLNVKNWVPIPYQNFIEHVTSFFPKVLFNIIEQNPYFIVGEQLVMEFRIIHIKDRGYYHEHKVAEKKSDEGSDIEHALFDISGLWLLQTIAAPWFYLKKIDFEYIYRYYLHELTHHYDFSNQQVARIQAAQKAKEPKILGPKLLYGQAEFVKKYTRYCTVPAVPFIYQSIFNLRIEGIADFNVRRVSGTFNIERSALKEYNENLINLTLKTKVQDAESFYGDKVAYNLTAGGELTSGRQMCLCIMLAIARITNIPYKLQVVMWTRKRPYENANKANWNELLSTYKTIYVTNVSTQLIDTAIAKIQSLTPEGFIEEYEKACQVLGITKEEYKVMTTKRMLGLRQLAIDNYLTQRKALRKRKGFE